MTSQNMAQGAGYGPCYYLPMTQGRKYEIRVWPDRILFSGQFLYLRDKEFYANKGEEAVASPADFLGMGHLKMRSYKKTLAFVVSGVVLGAVNALCEKASDLADKANSVLQWVGEALTLPGWLDFLLTASMAVCICFGLILLFSRKNVVEISFTDKRICVPERSLSDAEFAGLYQAVKSLSGRAAT